MPALVATGIDVKGPPSETSETGGADKRKLSQQPKGETGPDRTLLRPSAWKMVVYILWSLAPLSPLLGRMEREGIRGVTTVRSGVRNF